MRAAVRSVAAMLAIAVSLSVGVDASRGASVPFGASAATPAASMRPPERATSAPGASLAKRREAWHEAMMRARKPTAGCFRASYPNPDWRRVRCAAPPEFPQPLRTGGRPLIVGGGVNASPAALGGSARITIGSAVGSFDSVAGVTSETGTNPRTHATNVPNTFSLQLNTNTFTDTKVCQGSGCQGWLQFVLSTTHRSIYMEYWLINYGPACPAGWKHAAATTNSAAGCFRNSPATSVPALRVADLGQIRMTGTNDSDAWLNSVSLSTGGEIYVASDPDTVLFVTQTRGWRAAEFNVFGDGNSTQANFNLGATIIVRTTIQDGLVESPSCTTNGYTAETNNLTVALPCCPSGNGSQPAISFTESNAAGATSQCVAPPPPPVLAAPNCRFQTSCPFYQNQPPQYAMTCPSTSDFYSWSGTPVNSTTPPPSGMQFLSTGTMSSGTTTDQAVFVAACFPGTRNQCSSYSIDVGVANYCHPSGPPIHQPPPTCTQCGSNRKCCPDPFGGRGHVCVSETADCPPLQ